MTQEQKIQEMQILEQGLQQILMQKQAFYMELSESEAALKELEKSSDEVFKVIGQLMIKSDKKKIQEDLEKKKKLLNIRLKTFETQEQNMSEKVEKIRQELMKEMKK